MLSVIVDIFMSNAICVSANNNGDGTLSVTDNALEEYDAFLSVWELAIVATIFIGGMWIRSRKAPSNVAQRQAKLDFSNASVQRDLQVPELEPENLQNSTVLLQQCSEQLD